MLYNIDHATIEAAAKEKWPDVEVTVSDPYWINPEASIVRVGLHLVAFDTSFGANFNYVEGKFQ